MSGSSSSGGEGSTGGTKGRSSAWCHGLLQSLFARLTIAGTTVRKVPQLALAPTWAMVVLTLAQVADCPTVWAWCLSWNYEYTEVKRAHSTPVYNYLLIQMPSYPDPRVYVKDNRSRSLRKNQMEEKLTAEALHFLTYLFPADWKTLGLPFASTPCSEGKGNAQEGRSGGGQGRA